MTTRRTRARVSLICHGQDVELCGPTILHEHAVPAAGSSGPGICATSYHDPCNQRGTKMCLLCTAALNGRDLARRAHALQLLALVEQPDGLPVDTALRLAREILALIEMDAPGRRCDAVAPPEADIADAADRRLS